MNALAKSSRSPSPDRRRDLAYQDAELCYSGLSDAELAGVATALRHELEDCADLDLGSAEVCRFLTTARLLASQDVQQRRQRRSALDATADGARFIDGWSGLADEVRRRAPILNIFEVAGHPITRRGAEWAGACFACGGTDRLVVFPNPDARHDHPRAWCRRCGGYWDAIGCLRNLSAEGADLGYFDAVALLAAMVGIALPSPVVSPQKRSTRIPRKAFVEFVGGQAVAR